MRNYVLVLSGLTFSTLSVAATTCESLTSLKLPDTTITLAAPVAPGAFQPSNASTQDGAVANTSFKDLPGFCRVAATLKPSADSDIKIEVWLPAADGWNRKFQAVGNGGWAGVISYAALADALRVGYAGASTDTGHTGGSGRFALDHPEKLADFGWRSEHEMTVKAKAIIQAYYGSAPRLSYWNGCSTGGRQGLKEAQMFPADYDGIIAGAPANRTAIGLWIAFAMLKDPASYIPKSKYPLIHEAAIKACDANDGLRDGLIDDPRKCKFDPSVLLCKGADSPSCLTAPQVETARKLYSAATNPRTGQELFPSWMPGSELTWTVAGSGPNPPKLFLDQMQYVVFKDPNWDWRTFDFDKDIERSERPGNVVMNATDPNLKAFFSHNGKLLLYHGWTDTMVAPLLTVKYYNSVVDTLGGVSNTFNNVRLFMEPGMDHCRGGEGPNVFDKVGAMEQWVEKGKAPDSLIASHLTTGKVDRTRPLCPYPQVAMYTGAGSIDDAANFRCAAPKQ